MKSKFKPRFWIGLTLLVVGAGLALFSENLAERIESSHPNVNVGPTPIRPLKRAREQQKIEGALETQSGRFDQLVKRYLVGGLILIAIGGTLVIHSRKK